MTEVFCWGKGGVSITVYLLAIQFVLSYRNIKVILKGISELSQHQVADIAIGDKVNIELSKFPSHTYGYLLGEVSSVSYVPSNKTYAVEVELPDGMYTTSKLEVDYEVGLVGKAEIITSSRSILSRIFGQIINF